jgi:3-oxoadipate CoA-transferase, beta subunit
MIMAPWAATKWRRRSRPTSRRDRFANLSIGQPTIVSDYLAPGSGVIPHTENGMLGIGPEAVGDQIDLDPTNAGKISVTELPGAAYFQHADSFAMMRGGHLDVCVPGAFQVSEHGDLATGTPAQPMPSPRSAGAR